MTLRACPVCGRRFEQEGASTPPFCSDRCRRIDLGRWLDEKYAVPVDPADDLEGGEDGSQGPGESEDDG